MVCNKPQRRNPERRKEKSRDAARSRRSKESEIFADICNILPVTGAQAEQMDKTSVIRLAVAYIKLQDMLACGNMKSSRMKDEVEIDTLATLPGFVLVLSTDGDIVYVSEDVTEYLGLHQVDMLGRNILDYTHLCDHNELQQNIASEYCNISVRMKCTLAATKRRSHNLTSASYKVMHVTGNINQGYLLCIANPISHPIALPSDTHSFISKHTPDMKFISAEDNMTELLGHHLSDVEGMSVYLYHHAMDSKQIQHDFKTLLEKGQVETNPYRMLAADGGFAWVITEGTVMYSKHGRKLESVVCVNHVISGVVEKEAVISVEQKECSLTATSTVIADSSEVISVEQKERECSTTETSTVIADSSDKLRQYLDEQSHELQADLEDLRHLAPTDGSCVVPLCTDLFDDLFDFSSFEPEELIPLSIDSPSTTASYCSPSTQYSCTSQSPNYTEYNLNMSDLALDSKADDQDLYCKDEMWGSTMDVMKCVNIDPKTLNNSLLEQNPQPPGYQQSFNVGGYIDGVKIKRPDKMIEMKRAWSGSDVIVCERKRCTPSLLPTTDSVLMKLLTTGEGMGYSLKVPHTKHDPGGKDGRQTL